MAKVLSIEIGTTLTEIVEMDYKVRNPKVYKSLMISTPEGVLDEGMLYGYEHFADALKKMIKSKGFKAKKAIFSISSNRIASREVEIPYLKENQIRDYVLANATDYFPVDITEYNISYSILEHLQNEDGGKAIRINALAVPTELLESYRDFAREAGLELEAIDYDGNSLYQAAKKECSVGSQIVIKIDEKSTIVTVMKDGVQSLTRTVPYGIEEAVDTIIYSHIYSDNTSHSEAISYLRTVKCVNPAFDMEAYRKAKAEEKAKALAEAQAQAAGEGGDSDNQDGAGQNIDGFGQGMDFFGFNGEGSEGAVGSGDDFGSGTDSGSSDAFGSGADGSSDAFGGSGTDSGSGDAFGSGTADIGSSDAFGNSGLDSSAGAMGTGVAVMEEEDEEVSPQLLEIREHVTFSFENLVSGLSTVLDLYYSRTKGQKIDRVLLTGIGGTIQGMDELITNTLDVPAQQIRSLEGIQLGKVFKSGIFGEYVGCIGATIKPVDFLIKEKKVKNAGTDIVSIGRLVFIGCVGASVVMLAMSLPPYLDASNTNKTLRSQLQSVVSIIPIYQKYTLSKQAYEFVDAAYSQKDEPVAHIVEFLEEMEEKMPADVLVSTINSDNDSISITMSVSTKEEAADVYQQFCTFKSLEYVTIENLTDETTDAGDGLVTFTLVGVYAEKSEEDIEGEEGEAEGSEETESVEETEEGDVRFSSEDTSAEGSSDSGSGATDEDLGEEDAGDGSTDEESGVDEGTEETGTDESAEETSN